MHALLILIATASSEFGHTHTHHTAMHSQTAYSAAYFDHITVFKHCVAELSLRVELVCTHTPLSTSVMIIIVGRA